MKTIFFGTPEYVNPLLDYLIDNENIIAVVTRCDKPAKRHLQSLPSEVKQNAIKKLIRVFSVEKIDDAVFISNLSAIKPDVGIVAAFGKILPKKVLDIFSIGCVNLHFSLLPKYRGAAPIQRALIDGETETGVTSFWMNEGMDTGRIIFQKKINIDKNDDTNTLREKLIPVALDVLRETVVKIKENYKGEEQVGNPSFAPQLKKEDGKIDVEKTAETIFNLIRGTKPWPGAFITIHNSQFTIQNLRILDAQIIQEPNYPCSDLLPIGSVVALHKNIGFVLKCGKGYLLIKSVHPPSKNVMSAWSFLQGHNLKIGDKLD
ncbi:MAG: methionyl-tRNA formyltransferase [Elusimicrobia bacterium RIFOXYC2_FULL_34_12]|nr:MAG: methionyl-tRNA formyltransferase [Elusimicrobia bacterium RIFOXYC2_FULL_34_12]OGS39020.1 MAG: methionyl-tRNA formyltransferase [Elusimicrobia bacterium RIFOXYD2_FULL_34_30]HAM39683.1 methionyl-tRNA formyltransferase [Elusimicrobiota bacterium]